MITPINGHLLIEPVVYESFVAQDKTLYEEVGKVIDVSAEIVSNLLKKGDLVYFDSWMSAKYPTGEGNGFFWLVRAEDVRALKRDV